MKNLRKIMEIKDYRERNLTLRRYVYKYGKFKKHITTEGYEIFRIKDIIETFYGFTVHNPSDLISLEGITIIQHVSRDSCLEDFSAIYQSFSRNINNISLFLDKFDIAVCIDIHVKAFDSKKAIAVCELMVNKNIDYINFIFEFPNLNTDAASRLISNLDQFCENPILRNENIRLLNFPFCFIPAAKYKILYRHLVDPLKSNIFLQQDRIGKLNRKKLACFKPCKSCRAKVPCYAHTNIRQFSEYNAFVSPKTQDTLVFAGGSLQKQDYCDNDDIVYAGPAEQGDMFMAILEGFKNIIIIDGYFYFKFPCTTFEVILALDHGINILGSSSIGALRAVELDNWGMVGRGYVYEYLKRQYMKPYHIVAQTYDERDMPLTIPLVNIIYFLEHALSEEIITKDQFNICLNIADSIYFGMLSFKYFFKQLKSGKGISRDTISKLENYLSCNGEEFFNIKKKDAIQLLNEFRNILESRGHDYVKKTFNQAKAKYLKLLYDKYRCNYDFSLPKNWKTLSLKSKISVFHSIRGNRDCPPQKTCKLAELFFKDLDIIIADTTKFDLANSFIINIIFVPFYFLEYPCSSSTGDGDIFEEALASAYMELVERIPLFKFNVNALSHGEIGRESFDYKNLPQYHNWDESSRLKNKKFKDTGYVKVTNILSAGNIFIPKLAAMSLTSGSDGNSSGNSLPEAILYGIYELIERDTLRIYEFDILKKLQSKLVINQAEIKDRRCQTLLEQFRAKGCKIVLLNLLNVYDIPCVCCFIYDSNHEIKRHGSTAVRADLNSAVYAALHEGYMGYIVYFSGIRDDFQSSFNKYARTTYKQEQLMFFKARDFVEIGPPIVRFNSIVEELEYTINKLTNIGVGHIIVVNTSPNEEYSVKSVKVIIPKLELISVSWKFRHSSFYHEKVNRTIALIKDLAN